MKGTFIQNFSKYVFLNESISWTPDLIEKIEMDRTIMDRIVHGNKEYLKSFLVDHRGKMNNLLTFRKTFSDEFVEVLVNKMTKGGISLFTLFDDSYPSRLKKIPDPPLVLFHIGTLFDLSGCVAISGTRTPVESVRRRTFELSSRLAEEGYTVISGLAKGVDTSAHKGALSHENGRTVAVMANGLDRIIPKCNEDLAKKIAARGAVLSEKTLRPEPSKYDFIRRNRIISGISGVQIIMQSTGSGGTEHQFNTALSQGKPVIVYRGTDLPEVSRRSAESMIRRGARGFGTVEEAIDLVRNEWDREGSAAGRENIPLDQWI